MSTAAVVGLADPEGGWCGVYVGHEGGPEYLGRSLLNLVVELGGNLDAAWEMIARPPDGWRLAFSEAYEAGENREYFATGRGDSSLRSDDAFVRNSAVYWYIFDLRARTLDIWENTKATPPLYERVRFLDAGRLGFDIGPEGPLDWRNRRASFGQDDPGETTAILLPSLLERLPIVSKTLAVCALNPEAATLTREGLVFPLVVYLSEPDATQEAGVRVTDILEHDTYLLIPRRVLSDRRRCEIALTAALDTINASAAEEACLVYATLGILPELFPFDLLDLELNDAALQAAVRERVRSCFESRRTCA